MPFDMIFFGVFAAMAGFFVYRIVRYKGLRGALFGATIQETIGEVSGARQGPMSIKLKVHVLGAREDAEHKIGLELVARSFASWQMMPMTLPRSEAQKLLMLLEKAMAAR